MASTTIPTALSFGGCGFLGVYHVGVARAFQLYGESLLKNIKRFAGASAGSLAAAVLATSPDKVYSCKALVYDLADVVRKKNLGVFSRGFVLSEHVEKLVNTVLPENAHELANNKVFISLTRKQDKKNVIISYFNSREDLIKCLVCSCHIPFYSGQAYPEFRGEKYCDGGLTNNMINFAEDKMLFVTPFSGPDIYICPKDPVGPINTTICNQHFHINLRNVLRAKDAMIPPSKDKLDKYYNQGFLDALQYLEQLSANNPQLFQIGPRILCPSLISLLRKSSERRKSLKISLERI